VAAGGSDFVVVATSASRSQTDARFIALQGAGFHPIAGYRGVESESLADEPPSYPILAPKGEQAAVQAFLRALEGGAPAEDQYEPPVATTSQVKRTAGALLVMGLIVVGVTGLLLFAQFLGGLMNHPR
jgi:hypothetical protein